MTKSFIFALCLLALAGCNSTVGLTGSFCESQQPIRLTAAERTALTPAEKRDILAINRYGADNCGWTVKGI